MLKMHAEMTCVNMPLGSFINEVMVLGGGGQGKNLLLKRVTIGVGGV